jgi:LacI family transcriptional regulator
MATVRDVAERAGVSPITVSRVINNTGYISRATRDKVEAAIVELGYVPNVLARSLRSKRSHTLAFVTTDITNPFFTSMARGIEDAASDAGYTVLFCNTDESAEKEDRYVQLLLQKQTDGILLVPALSSPRSVQLLHSQDTPVVVLDRGIGPLKADVVRCDSVQGAQDLINILIERGHRRIAALSGPVGTSTADDRVRGYELAMQAAGLSTQDLIVRGQFTEPSGFEMATAALRLTPRPTAFFASNNFMALGALRAIEVSGLAIPKDISVAAFDDVPPVLAQYAFLTVVAQPAYQMGQQAVALLLERLRSDEQAPYREVILPTTLIVRGSVGPAPVQAQA